MIAIFPEIAACAASGDIERLGILVRSYFGAEQKFAPQLSMEPVLRSAGIHVQRLPLDSLAALLAKDEQGTFEIVAVVSEGLSADSERFILAHMLGHFLLHIQPLIAKGDWQVSGFRETTCALKRYGQKSSNSELSFEDQELESQADDFAASTLLPRAMVTRAMERVRDVETVAKFFGLPTMCMSRRLQQLGVTANEPVNFIDATQQIGKPLEAKSLATDINPEGQLHAPKAEGTIPKSFAASSYERSEAAAKRPVAKVHKASESEKSSQKKTPGILKGMERIRELARQIDKGND